MNSKWRIKRTRMESMVNHLHRNFFEGESPPSLSSLPWLSTCFSSVSYLFLISWALEIWAPVLNSLASSGSFTSSPQWSMQGFSVAQSIKELKDVAALNLGVCPNRWGRSSSWGQWSREWDQWPLRGCEQGCCTQSLSQAGLLRVPADFQSPGAAPQESRGR